MEIKQLNSMINVNSKIYVACPANFASGGPELLHQLVYRLNKLGLNAFMYYTSVEQLDPVHSEYKFYQNPFVLEIEDNRTNILVAPEVNTSLLYQFSKVQKIIWWLSVDNYITSLPRYNLLKSLIKMIFSKKKYFSFKARGHVKHFVQSYYAYDYLKKNNINEADISYLSDYLSSDFLKNNIDVDLTKKNDIVAYNPKKGFEFTKKLIENYSSVRFVPIENMSREQVIALLKSAKVYIDFGYHPGKDRIPREAAILGCCVITNKKGSAAFFNDVKIPDEYKFDEKIPNVYDVVIEKIQECFSAFELNYNNFESYRKMILEEENLFVKNVSEIFCAEG